MIRFAHHKVLGTRFKVLEPITYNLKTKATEGSAHG
jgi:hypothetical protein